MRRTPLPAVWLLATLPLTAAPILPPPPDLAEYRTVATAQHLEPRPDQNGGSDEEGLSGYLGVTLRADASGRLTIGEVAPDSPAAQSGLKKGDALLEIGGQRVATVEQARTRLQSSPVSEPLPLRLEREGTRLTLTPTLGAVSRPMRLNAVRVTTGLRMAAPTEAEGIAVTGIVPEGPAARAGLKPGDVILQVNGQSLGQELQLGDLLSERGPGDRLTLQVRRGKEEFQRTIEAVEDASTAFIPPGERRKLSVWKKENFRLAVIPLEFPEKKHSEKIALTDWEAAFFSHGTYNRQSPTGQAVYGSVADYYDENSLGKLRFEGRVFDWVQAQKSEKEYDVGVVTKAHTELLGAAVDAVLARDGAQALEGYDGIVFVYAGEKYGPANRGSVLWPHRSSFRLRGHSWPYVIVAELGPRGAMSTISTPCHELGHILGLPDLYARPENPGSEGAGVWSVMAGQVMNGRPQHFCAWSKEQLGWLRPTVLDPTVPQKLILRPVEGSATECYKVLARPDGSEYFLLENRRRKGFDQSLPAEGLLIWRVVVNRPLLEESHGIPGPIGPRVFLPSIPWPSRANDAFTPWTMPSSRSQLGGSTPVYITNIRQLPDGRVSFQIGYEYE